jgi:hypothetical protein
LRKPASPAALGATDTRTHRRRLPTNSRIATPIWSGETHLPPELADAAVAQWEKALSLTQQTAQVDDSAARAQLEQLRRETTQHARAIVLREKDWALAARVRERALVEARDQVNVLLKELAADRAELRSREARIADLESQLEAYRQQLTLLVTRAVARNRALKAKKPATESRKRLASKTRRRAKKRRPRSNLPKTRARR